jgi:GAF domain-containing protein
VIACAAASGQLRPLAQVGFPPAAEADWFQAVPQFTLSQYFTAPLIQRLEAGEVIVSDLTRLEHPGLPGSGGQQTLVAPLRLGQQLLGILTLEYGSTSHRFTPTEYSLAGAVAKLAALVLERERLFREREAARASALAERETARQMNDFLSLVGHELRTPLTSLKARTANPVDQPEGASPIGPAPGGALAGS